MKTPNSTAPTGDDKKFAVLFRYTSSRNLVIIAAVIVFATAGSVLLVGSHAATPAASFEAEAGTLSGTARTLGDATASGGNAVKFGDSAATLYGWQKTPSNTGLASVGLTCANLPVYTGANPVPAGSRITGVRFTDGLVDLSKGNIVIDKSCFRPTSGGGGLPLATTTNYNVCGSNGCSMAPDTVTISNSDFDGTLLSQQNAAFTAACFLGVANLINNYCHHFGSGLAIFNAGDHLSATVTGNYVADLVAYGDPATTGNHSDGFTVRDFDISTTPSRQLIVSNNYIDCSSGNDTGAFFIEAYAGSIGNVTATGNLLKGGGYVLGLTTGYGYPYSNVVATNNRFAPTGWGAAYVQGGSGWNQWANNYLNDATKTDNKGAVVPDPSP